MGLDMAAAAGVEDISGAGLGGIVDATDADAVGVGATGAAAGS